MPMWIQYLLVLCTNAHWRNVVPSYVSILWIMACVLVKISFIVIFLAIVPKLRLILKASVILAEVYPIVV